MLTLCDPRHDRNCQGFSRRELLKIGGLGFGGLLTLPQLLAMRARPRAAERGQGPLGRPAVPAGRAVAHRVLRPQDDRARRRSAASPARCRPKLPGITFGGTFPKLAALADKLAVVRSYASRNADHTYQSVTTGRQPAEGVDGLALRPRRRRRTIRAPACRPTCSCCPRRSSRA